MAAVATACTGPDADRPDVLAELADAAHSDVALASAAARAHPELSDAATSVADARAAHADGLRREIKRLGGTRQAARSGKKAEPDVPGSADGARERLRESLLNAQQQAARTAARVSGYRAGLTGSISAGCASLLEVLA